MKSFLKYTLATIVGFLIVNILMIFIFFVFIGAVASMGKKPVEIKNNSILQIELKASIPDRASNNPFENFNLFNLSESQPIGLNNILNCIRKAAQDSRIQGIYLELTQIQSNFGGMATVEEIRNALAEFKKSGKFIYSYSNLGYSQNAYYLATIADSVFVNPETPLMLTGMGGNVFFYKNLLDKLGIQAEIVKVGKYKSAVEPFTRTEISESNREQVEAYLHSIWGNILKGISVSRSVSTDSLTWLTNHLDYRTAQEEQAFGLYDGVCYMDQMIRILKQRCGLQENEKLYYTTLSDYNKANSAPVTETAKDKIAVIYASGEIGMEQSASKIGPALAETIRKIRKDKNIKAVVMRVNSPGGSALTSDIIWREVKLSHRVYQHR